MEWTVREQVRFMAALARGEVVSPATSAYLLEAMQPVESQRWGLARVGASAVKGGWLTPTTETRQMGILDGYAVAVITAAVGPAVLQSDGDEAHVEQLDRLATMLADRLDPGLSVSAKAQRQARVRWCGAGVPDRRRLRPGGAASAAS